MGTERGARMGFLSEADESVLEIHNGDSCTTL